MDYLRSVEALIPGVQGKVLGVLARTETELTMRAVAQLAGVSSQQASVVLGRLIDLGVVARRDVPPAALVGLVPDNLAAQAVLGLARLRQAAMARLAALATQITPPPAGLIVYGSFARGHARTGSDIDVLAVRPTGATEVTGSADSWTDSLGAWVDEATRTVGNPVNLVEVNTDELPGLLRRPPPSLWREIAAEGIVLLGSGLVELASAA